MSEKHVYCRYCRSEVHPDPIIPEWWFCEVCDLELDENQIIGGDFFSDITKTPRDLAVAMIEEDAEFGYTSPLIDEWYPNFCEAIEKTLEQLKKKVVGSEIFR